MRKMKLSLLLLIAMIALVSGVSAALPTVIWGTPHYPTALNAYLDFKITSGGNIELPNSPPLYIGGCFDPQLALHNGVNDKYEVYSSLLPMPAKIPSANWPAINYVLSQINNHDKYVMQSAIWNLQASGVGHYWYPAGATPAQMAAIKAEADQLVLDAIGSSFVPGPGDYYAVVLWNTNTQMNYQPVIIETPVTIPSPEFPTLALPVALILGTVFIVYVVKRRDE